AAQTTQMSAEPARASGPLPQPRTGSGEPQQPAQTSTSEPPQPPATVPTYFSPTTPAPPQPAEPQPEEPQPEEAQAAAAPEEPEPYRETEVVPPVRSAALDEEEKQHNDARRFARLLVSEIKLYNEQKVAEGRRNGDLYDRLKEDIDRSRQMYDKRVTPAVAAKVDYFYDELVNTLAEGDVEKLGANCPGPVVGV
ncbi:MAG TPA: hypothetical protein VLD57_09290, partial [Blastocatellia bacterium]|nr:hypothetical protein [Blastocatellia bacterium]